MNNVKTILFVLILLVAGNAFSQNVVVHHDVALEKLTKNMVRSIFLMRTTAWENGSPIVVVVLEDEGALHATFCKEVLGVFPYQLQQVWDRLVFTGTGQSPRFAQTTDEMKQLVSSTPGAIGYIDQEHIDHSLKIIRVDHATD